MTRSCGFIFCSSAALLSKSWKKQSREFHGCGVWGEKKTEREGELRGQQKETSEPDDRENTDERGKSQVGDSIRAIHQPAGGPQGLVS